MVPWLAVVVLDRIPVTVNGKLDQAALPAPSYDAAPAAASAGPVEELLAGVFAEVLGVDRVGPEDSFASTWAATRCSPCAWSPA